MTGIRKSFERRTVILCKWLMCGALLVGSTVEPVVGGLRQVNWAEPAGDVINHMPSVYNNEYPWLSGDGKLLFWTRQNKKKNCATDEEGCQRLWVSYIQNWEQIFGARANNSRLPALDMSVPMPLTPVNDLVGKNQTIKSFAVCEEGYQPTSHGSGNTARWKYQFTLFMSIGSPTGKKLMYRAHRVSVLVRKNTEEILSNMTMTGGYGAVIPPAYRSNGSLANEIEPFLTRDGKYLFWASNGFNGATGAKYIGPVAACTQVNQTPKLYSTLPSAQFPWKDQYNQGLDHMRTRKTNYHNIFERSRGGVTALVFEGCQGMKDCAAGGTNNRDCQCAGGGGYPRQNEHLSTTGFGSGNNPPSPHLIQNCCGSRGLNLSGQNTRTTHPATSPRHPNGTWTLFYMRNSPTLTDPLKARRIWYTKVKE